MSMGRKERIQTQAMLQQRYVESNKPTQANMAVFYDEQDHIVYAGIVTDWPMIISTDIEWGKVMELDATKEPFAGKTVKFFSPFTGN